MSSPSSTALRDWTSRLNWKRSLDGAAARWSPELFRSAARVRERDSRPLRELILPWQQADFAALEPAWMEMAGIPARYRPGVSQSVAYRRAYLERPRGHSKTFDTAVQIAWVLIAARQQVRGLAAAADKDQSLLIWQSVERLSRLNPHLTADLRFTCDCIRNVRTGSRVDFITSDVASSWGHDPDFVICDELCHWEKESFWQSLYSSAAKRPGGVLLVLSNAGVGRGWQWRIREMARCDSRWYFSRLDGPLAPWITPESLAEQKAGLPRPVYERLWLNVWQHSDGGFVTLAQAQACCDPKLVRQERGQPRCSYVAAIDYAEKHDLTAACLVHSDGGRVIVDRMDVVRPTPDQFTPVQWVEDWIHAIARDFANVRFVLDEHQLVGVIQRLEQQYRIERFRFRGGLANHEMAITLSRLIRERNVAWYEGCGAIDAPCDALGEPADDLESELASLVLESRGRSVRFNHVPDGRHHDDRAFSLGAACLTVLKAAPGSDFLEITQPTDASGINW